MIIVFIQDRKIECRWLWLIKQSQIIDHNSPVGGAQKIMPPSAAD